MTSSEKAPISPPLQRFLMQWAREYTARIDLRAGSVNFQMWKLAVRLRDLNYGWPKSAVQGEWRSALPDDGPTKRLYREMRQTGWAVHQDYEAVRSWWRECESQWWRGYSDELHRPPPPPDSDEPGDLPLVGADSPPKTLVSVISDVHLGVGNSSNSKAFFEWLEQRREGEIVVLLGDILDFWIYGCRDTRGDLLRRVETQWKELWRHLKILADRGVELHYVPGNHDSFLWFIEASDHLPWGRELMVRSAELASLKKRTSLHRFTSVASIHYPYLNLVVGGENTVFTHGHFAEWLWKFNSQIRSEGSEHAISLSTFSVAFTHKHARAFRKLANAKDHWKERTQRLEDVGISITNRIIETYRELMDAYESSPGPLLDKIDLAINLYFGGRSNAPADEQLAIRDALLELDFRRRSADANEMPRLREEVLAILNNRRIQNITLPKSPTGVVAAQISSYTGDTVDHCVIFGHHHEPREETNVFDTGGYVDEFTTSLHIHENGLIDRKQ